MLLKISRARGPYLLETDMIGSSLAMLSLVIPPLLGHNRCP